VRVRVRVGVSVRVRVGVRMRVRVRVRVMVRVRVGVGVRARARVRGTAGSVEEGKRSSRCARRPTMLRSRDLGCTSGPDRTSAAW